MASDRKAAIVDGRTRVLTIHDGANITPTLVAILDTLAAVAPELAERDYPEGRPTAYDRVIAERRARPILIARADGIAVYVADRRVL